MNKHSEFKKYCRFHREPRPKTIDKYKRPSTGIGLFSEPCDHPEKHKHGYNSDCIQKTCPFWRAIRKIERSKK